MKISVHIFLISDDIRILMKISIDLFKDIEIQIRGYLSTYSWISETTSSYLNECLDIWIQLSISADI